MDKNFLSEAFLEEHISDCREALKQDGYILPFFLIQQAHKTPVYMPIVGEFRPHELIYVIVKQFKPQAVVFTSQGAARKRPLPKDYRYGDIQKSKKKQEVILINVIDFRSKVAKLIVVPFKRVHGDVKFDDPHINDTLDDTGPVGDIIRELFRETSYIR